jgi:hypothetical protein
MATTSRKIRGWTGRGDRICRAPVRRLLLFCLQEVHVLNKYEDDFYGDEMRIVVLGCIRPEQKFSSVGESTRSLHLFQVERSSEPHT